MITEKSVTIVISSNPGLQECVYQGKCMAGLKYIATTFSKLYLFNKTVMRTCSNKTGNGLTVKRHNFSSEQTTANCKQVTIYYIFSCCLT